MRRFAVPVAVIAVAVALLIVLAISISNQGSNESIAYSVASHRYRVAPDYARSLPTLDGFGGRRSLASYRGQLVLVNFFASWCVPCQQEAPVLAAAQKLLSAHGGTVLGIAFQNSPDAARQYLRSYHLRYPAVTDPSSDLASTWGVTGVPDSYLLDRQGKIVWLNLYQLTSSFDTKTLPQLIARYA